jgi:hypothetical protein
VEVVRSSKKEGVSMDFGVMLSSEPVKFHITVENLFKSKMDYVLLGDLTLSCLILSEIPTILSLGFEYLRGRIYLVSEINNVLRDRVVGTFVGSYEHRFEQEFITELSYNLSETWSLRGGFFTSSSFFSHTYSSGKTLANTKPIMGIILGADFSKKNYNLKAFFTYDTREKRLKEIYSENELKPIPWRLYTEFNIKI